MSVLTSRQGRALAAATVALTAGLVATTSFAGASGRSVSVSGPVTAYAVADNPLTGVSASVHETVTDSGTTIVTLHLWGFGPEAEGRTFGAHAHINGCGTTGVDAGPHYTHPAPAADLEAREIWLDYTVNDGGNARAKATRDWTIVPTASAPAGARSVIFHALATNQDGVAGTRLACIDVPFVG